MNNQSTSTEQRLSRRSSLTEALSRAMNAEVAGLDISESRTANWIQESQTVHETSGDFDDLLSSSGKHAPFSVLEEFDRWKSDPQLAIAVAAIKALTAFIKQSDATTMMGLEKELRGAAEQLKSRHRTSISLTAGCNIFLKFVTRTSNLEHENFEVGKARIIERGEKFSDISFKARETIAQLGQDFVIHGCTILTHGFSRVVLAICKKASLQGKHFKVICTEGRPDGAGLKMAQELWKFDIPVTLVLDAAMGYCMEKVDLVLVGAEGVVESGGIINVLGTFQLAVVAKTMKKPVYVAAESYKFARLFPLGQQDFGAAQKLVNFGRQLPPSVKVENAETDYTPPEFLTLLFTELGILTPSAVSDELIQLYL